MATERTVPIERLLGAGDTVAPSCLGVSGPHPVLVIGGTTQPLPTDTAVDVVELLEAAVDTAARCAAVVVTGATDAGIFHLLGRVLARAPARPAAVIGVAPADLVATPGEAERDGRVALEPHHTAFLLVPGTRWGAETPALSRLVDTIAGDRPSVALLIGGGEGSRAELDEHRRCGRAVLVVNGSGRLADELAADEASRGAFTIVDLADGADKLGRLLADALGETKARTARDRLAFLSVWPRFRPADQPPPPPLGPDATSRYPALGPQIDDAQRVIYPAFSACDVTAAREQNRYRWFLVLAIIGGLLTTVFGALQTWLHSTAWPAVVVATLGAATSAVTMIARRQGSLDSFLRARLCAERLRSLYFEHLAEPPPAHEAARDEALRRLEGRVAEIRFGPPR